MTADILAAKERLSLDVERIRDFKSPITGFTCEGPRPTRYVRDLGEDIATALAELSRLEGENERLREADQLVRDMVTAEDELIADLLEQGKQAEVLAIDFPIMHRMRAYLAKSDTVLPADTIDRMIEHAWGDDDQ